MLQLEEIVRERPDLARQIDELLKKLNDACAELQGEAVGSGLPIDLSIVIPVYNEEGNIEELYRRLTQLLSTPDKPNYEILFINDGSRDRSVELIHGLRSRDARVKLADFSRNFGHQAAITAGIDLSRGSATILMDADMQDPPEVILEMLEKWREGFEIVYAVRRKREDDAFLKRFFAVSFYRVIQRLANIEIPLDTGDFCLLDRKVVDQLKNLPEKNRFLRGLRSWLGFRQAAVTFDRPARFAGEAKYTFRQSLNLAINGLVGFSTFPLRVAVFAGFVSCLAAFGLVIWAVSAYFLGFSVERGWTSLIVLLLTVGGVQLILLGSIGEYIGRIYDEVKQRPNYVIRNFYE